MNLHDVTLAVVDLQDANRLAFLEVRRIVTLFRIFNYLFSYFIQRCCIHIVSCFVCDRSVFAVNMKCVIDME